MNVLIVGLGSMGKRRMRLIKQNYPEYNLFGFDTNDERSKDVSDMFGAKIFRDINDAIETSAVQLWFCLYSAISP